MTGCLKVHFKFLAVSKLGYALNSLDPASPGAVFRDPTKLLMVAAGRVRLQACPQLNGLAAHLKRLLCKTPVSNVSFCMTVAGTFCPSYCHLLPIPCVL
ncbi:hypothetical protein FHG87_009921 [Trinorchestia longiramus]|nr:hypothetical protein FHG87_009921 [Trinorchestia longiramus]